MAVLDTLPPPERVAFVLHDLFAVPSAAIAPLLGRSPEAAHQLSSRGGRRVRGAVPQRAVDADRHRVVVEAFFAAAHRADFGGLLALHHPNARLRADAVAVGLGAPTEVRGGAAVAEFFSGGARAARIALVGGTAGAVWVPAGVPKVVFRFTLRGATIRAIDLVAEPGTIAALDATVRADTRPPARRGPDGVGGESPAAGLRHRRRTPSSRRGSGNATGNTPAEPDASPAATHRGRGALTTGSTRRPRAAPNCSSPPSPSGGW